MPDSIMKLLAFRVTNFRSVRDSGWIGTEDVTALIGTNESGKTNLLAPLWKLNPAKEGEINLLTDAPRKDYNTYRQMEEKPTFIQARFELPDKLAGEIASKTGVAAKHVKIVEVSRDFDGNYVVNFPEATNTDVAATAADLSALFDTASNEIKQSTASGKADEALKQNLLGKLKQAKDLLPQLGEQVGADGIEKLQGVADAAAISDAPARSTVAPRFGQVVDALAAHAARLAKPGPNDSDEACKLVTDNLPVFVYYSTYGNLDSEIYLPHVIADLKRKDLSGKAEAKARTLRVLFDFVRLKPEEILELGKDWNEQQQGKPSEAQIQALNAKKKERSVLLQSASSELTTKFRDWWKQGVYRIRFEADGNHFRIWVSDDQRPEEIELESRSSGLQWFLSFYLVFLVESKATHHGAILLLDEPGHSLHPLAQRDLSLFFDSLAASNQLLYTTHSPFLVDADHLDRVRNVYVDDTGHTVASSNLRAGQAAAQSKSAYAVHAALGLSVCDTLFQGCRLVIVEGQSDQIYLSAIKTLLVGGGRFKPARELLFIPANGAKAIKTIASILGGKEDDLPTVLCDGDQAGIVLAKTLKDAMYKNLPDRVLLASDFNATPSAEIEDLLPRAFMTPILDRFLKGPDDQPFAPLDDAPLVPQVKAYAAKHGIALADGWKVQVARLVKARLTASRPTDDTLAGAQDDWLKLFLRLSGEQAEADGAKPVGSGAKIAVAAR